MIIETKPIGAIVNDHNKLRNIGEFDHRMIDIHVRDKDRHFRQNDIKILKNQIIDLPDLNFQKPLIFGEGFVSNGYKISLDINEFSDEKAKKSLEYHVNDTDIHFFENQIDHKNIKNKGKYTHREIDIHIDKNDNPHKVTADQLGIIDWTLFFGEPNGLATLNDQGKIPISQLPDSVLKATGYIGGGGGIQAETDPIFLASPAYGITSDDITHWATAYSWGDHASAGYLTTIAGLSHTALSDIGTNNHATIDLFIASKAQVLGLASLDAGGKIPVNQLPNSVMEYQGTWNATTNTPTLADGIGNAGDVYIVDVAGTQNLGSGNITFSAGDFCIYTGTIWEKSINAVESDPVFMAHVASGITSTLISNWSTAYGWGNHASAGYLTTISGLDHGSLNGISDDDHTQYALLGGRAGGQSLIGGTGSGDDLTLSSTGNATKGHIFFGTSTYDEVNNRLGIGTDSPSAKCHIFGAGNSDYGVLQIQSSSALSCGTLAKLGAYTYLSMGSSGLNLISWGMRFDADTTAMKRMYTSADNYLPYIKWGANDILTIGGALSNDKTNTTPTLVDKLIVNVGSGAVGVGVTATAWLHIKAGTATAGTAPIKLTSGVHLTVPEAGAIEYNGTRFYATPSAIRETIAFLSDISVATTPIVCTGRLTLETGVPFNPADVTSKNQVFFTPYQGGQISIYDGADWNLIEFTEQTVNLQIARTGTVTGGSKIVTGLSATDDLFVGMTVTGGGYIDMGTSISSIDSESQLTLNQNALLDGEITLTFSYPTSTYYDVFAYEDTGVLELEVVAWTDSTTRAVAHSYVDGVRVKSTDNTRRYIGCFGISGSPGETEDSELNRFCQNYYNKKRKNIKVTDTTNSWNYTTATWRAMRGQSSNVAHVLDGDNEDECTISVIGISINSSGATSSVGVGINSSSTNSAQIHGGAAGTFTTQQSARYDGVLSLGLNAIYPLEISLANGTTTWYGDRGLSYYSAGLSGSILC